jgi:hypothetical protein
MKKMKGVIAICVVLVSLVTVITPVSAADWIPVQKISTHPDNVYGDNYPQIAVDSSGNSYVTWDGWDGTDDEIYWVKVDSSGTPGTVQKISTHPDNVTNGDFTPQIAVDSSGNSYVTWWGNDGTDDEIYWVKVDSSGTPGTVQKISTHLDNVNNDDYYPQIAVDSSGTSYVTWYGYDSGDDEIYWVDIASGVPGTVQKISKHADNVSNDDYYPQIAVDSGNSYVTWYGWDGTDFEIYWVDITSGTPGTVQKISTHADNVSNDDYCPQIAANSGTSYVTWYGDDGTDWEIYWMDIASGTSGTVQKISTHADNISHNDDFPQIAVNSGNSYVTWCGDDGIDDEIYWTAPITEEEIFANPIAAFMPVKTYHLRQVNSCLGCIEESLPDDIPQDIQDLLDEMQLHIDNANTTGNSIYANNELLKALECCEDIQEKLDITCDL